MECTFYRSGTGSYLVVRTARLSDGYVRGMLRTGGVPSLLEEHIVQMGESCELHYRISGMQTLEKCFAKRRMRTQEAADLLDRIVRVQTACAAHLLPERHLFLTPDLIYVPYLQTDYRFLYLPEEETDVQAQIRELADFLMKHISYEEEDDPGVELVYGLQDAAGRDGFDLRDWWRQNRGRTGRGGTAVPGGTGDVPERTDAAQPDPAGYAAAGCAGGERKHAESGTEAGGSGSLKIISLTEDWDTRWQDETIVDPNSGSRFFAFRKNRKERASKKRTAGEQQEKEDARGGKVKKEKKTKRREKKRKGAHRQEAKRKKEEKQEKRKWGKGRQEAWYADGSAAGVCAAEWDSPEGGAAAETDYGSYMQESRFLREAAAAGAQEGTVCLSDPQLRPMRQERASRTHVLIPMDGGAEIALDRTYLLLGSSARNADIVLQDPTVSRIHAEILCDEDAVRIEDCNSSNGTVVDGRMLGPNEQKTLETGMHIRLGRSEFVFR